MPEAADRPVDSKRSRVRALLNALSGIVQSRLRLALLEIEEEKGRIRQLLALTIAGAILAVMTLQMLGILVLVLCWDNYRIPATVGLTVAYALIAVLLFYKARQVQKREPRPMSATLAQLKRDQELLNPVKRP